MERTQVSSSLITSIGYDAASQTLELELTGGSVYQYFDVPESEYEAMMSAPSHGAHFNANIKDVYSYAKA